MSEATNEGTLICDLSVFPAQLSVVLKGIEFEFLLNRPAGLVVVDLDPHARRLFRLGETRERDSAGLVPPTIDIVVAMRLAARPAK